MSFVTLQLHPDMTVELFSPLLQTRWTEVVMPRTTSAWVVSIDKWGRVRNGHRDLTQMQRLRATKEPKEVKAPMLSAVQSVAVLRSCLTGKRAAGCKLDASNIVSSS